MSDPTTDASLLSGLQVPPVAVPPPNPPKAPHDDSVQEVDRNLDRLEHLTTELEQIEQKSREVRSRWPADFCLSIIVPVYNERATIDQVLNKLVNLDMPKQIIVIDDGSTDGTREILSGWHHRDGVCVVLKPDNEGKGATLRAGFAHVEGSLVVVQDADLEYDPSDIESLVQPILAGRADVAYGSRFLEQRFTGSSAVHRWGNRFLTACSNMVTGLKLTDMETCYKVFPARLLNEIDVRQNGFGIEPELTAKLARSGVSFTEVPIAYHARDWDEGKKIGVADAFQAIFCIFRYAWFD